MRQMFRWFLIQAAAFYQFSRFWVFNKHQQPICPIHDYVMSPLQVIVESVDLAQDMYRPGGQNEVGVDTIIIIVNIAQVLLGGIVGIANAQSFTHIGDVVLTGERPDDWRLSVIAPDDGSTEEGSSSAEREKQMSQRQVVILGSVGVDREPKPRVVLGPFLSTLFRYFPYFINVIGGIFTILAYGTFSANTRLTVSTIIPSITLGLTIGYFLFIRLFHGIIPIGVGIIGMWVVWVISIATPMHPDPIYMIMMALSLGCILPMVNIIIDARCDPVNVRFVESTTLLMSLVGVLVGFILTYSNMSSS